MQGHLRNQTAPVTVDTRCEHCSENITLDIDTEMNITVQTAGAEPMIFTPDVEVFDIEAPTIVDDF